MQGTYLNLLVNKPPVPDSWKDVKLISSEALQQHGLHTDAGRLPLDPRGSATEWCRDLPAGATCTRPRRTGGVQINVQRRRGYMA